jgi:ADP-ribose pyrophosphatase YjhB (NUDIX family)
MSFDREYPSRPVVGVGAVVLVGAGDLEMPGIPTAGPARGVVLIKRRFEPLAGHWSLPGGAVEVGETLEAAITREVVEETGLLVDVGPVIDVFDRIMLDEAARVQYHFVLVDYLCRITGGRLAHGSDVSEAVIVDPTEMEAYDLTEKARSVIARGLEMSR